MRRSHPPDRGLPARGVEPLEPRVMLTLTPAGAEFRANSFLMHGQTYPAVAADADGDFVVAWESALQDGFGLGVYAQRFNAAGTRQGGEFRVNTTTRNRQNGAAVAMDDAGNFVIAWQNHENDFESDIRARLYNEAGTALTDEIHVNTFTANDQGRASVAMAPNGDFVVAWDSFNQDDLGRGIFARRFNAAGVPQGAEIPVNADTAGNQMWASVGVDAAGGFVVAWRTSGPDPAPGAFVRRFDPDGDPVGDEFPVVGLGSSDGSSRVAVGRSGEFAVAWHTWSMDAAGHRQGEVYARRYAPDGAPRGAPFIVNSTLPGVQGNPAPAIDAAGRLVVAFSGTDEAVTKNDVYVRRFDASGTPEGPDLLANVNPATFADEAAVATDGDGDVVVAWHGNPTSASEVDVYARRFRGGAPPAVTGVFLASSAWGAAFRARLPGNPADAALFGYAVPAASQLGPLPWGGLDRVSIRFNDDVVVAADDLSVRGVNVASYPISNFAYHAAVRTATWTLGRAISRDKVLLDLDAGAGGVMAAGQALDGEWAGNAGTLADAFPSGDGAPGGDFRFRVNVLPGDVNRDRAVNATDMLHVRRRLAPAAPYSVWCDVDGDAAIDLLDVAAVRRALPSSLPAAEPVPGAGAAAAFPRRPSRATAMLVGPTSKV